MDRTSQKDKATSNTQVTIMHTLFLGALLGGACSFLESYWTIRLNDNLPSWSLAAYLIGSWYVYAVAGACIAFSGTLLEKSIRRCLKPDFFQEIRISFMPPCFFLGLWSVEILDFKFMSATPGILDNVTALCAMILLWAVSLILVEVIALYIPRIRQLWIWSMINCLALISIMSVLLTKAPAHGWLGPGLISLVTSTFLIVSGPCLFLLIRHHSRYLTGSVFILLALSFVFLVRAGRTNSFPRDPEEQAVPYNVLILSIDTLQAKHLTHYGYNKNTTQSIEAFAQDAVTFKTAVAQTPKTSPSHTSILSGLHPFSHGVLKNGSMDLNNDSKLLSDRLSEKGYKTAAFVSGFTLTSSACRLPDRFQVYDDSLGSGDTLFNSLIKNRFPYTLSRLVLRRQWYPLGLRGGYDRPAEHTVDEAIKWMGRNKSDPFFMFVHFFDPHGGYIPPSPFNVKHVSDDLAREANEKGWHGDWQDNMSPEDKEKAKKNPKWLEYIVSQYDGEISYADMQAGKLIESLDNLGLKNNTLVVITADHGESLGSHGAYFAHTDLYEDTIRVPLIIRLPKGQQAGIRTSLVQLTDIVPTILDYLEIDPDAEFDGQSLLAYCRNEKDPPDKRPAISFVINGDDPILSIRDNSYKYQKSSTYDVESGQMNEPVEKLFNLKEDPGELFNIIGESPSLHKEYREDLSLHWEFMEGLHSEDANVDELLKEQLESLGYL